MTRTKKIGGNTASLTVNHKTSARVLQAVFARTHWVGVTMLDAETATAALRQPLVPDFPLVLSGVANRAG